MLRNDIGKRLTKVERYEDDEIEKLYEEISEILHQEGRDQVNTIVIGDFYSIVGEGRTFWT